MKHFLFDKFNNFTKSAELTSLRSFTKNLPGSLHLDPVYFTDNGFFSCGSTSDGYWTVTRTEARYYENDGTIHCLGSRYNNEYCENYKTLREHLTEIRCIQLVETDSFQITTEDHAGHQVGDNVYYAKFISPYGEFGRPLTMLLITEELPLETNNVKFINDLCFKIYAGFKSAKILCPSSFSPKSILSDSQGYYLGLLSDFSVSLEQSIDNVISKGTTGSDKVNTDEINEYGLEKWQLLKI